MSRTIPTPLAPTPSATVPPTSKEYRRYRVFALLPALLIIAGGLYLGLSQAMWIGFVAGLLFFCLCVGMVATDYRRSTQKHLFSPPRLSPPHLEHDA